MKQLPIKQTDNCQLTHVSRRPVNAWVAAVAFFLAGTILSTLAQTVTLNPGLQKNYWGGIGTTGLLTNSITVAETGGGPTTNIVLSLSGGNGSTITGTLTPSAFTNNGTSTAILSLANATAGFYPFTVSASGDAVASTNFNLFVVPQWAQTNVGSTGNWSDPTKWSGGAIPLPTDSVYIDHTTVGPWTNIVDSSRTIQSLGYLGNADEGASATLAVNTTIAAGQTLSVVGTNGFFMGTKSNVGTRPVYTFQGGTLLVSNTLADFSIIPSITANATRYFRVNMSGLTNLTVYANRMAIADINAIKNGPDGAPLVDFVLAQTNFIKATLTSDYNAPVFDTAISYMREDQAANNAQAANAQFRLGTSTTFNADSFGVGLGMANGSGSSAFSPTIGYKMSFNTSNSIAPTNIVIFRNTDGVSRMSLLAIGVDQGLNTAIANNRGIVDLRGGTTDMLVDRIWLGQDRTNTANASLKDSIGGLYFDWGKIDCNTLIAGNMKYTNNIGGAGLVGYVLVGTNGTLVVNNNLILGQTPADVTGFTAQAALVSGQVQINRGGSLRANQVTVGQYSGNNAITIAAGGTLEVSNVLAGPTTPLNTLTMNGGGLTLHMNDTNTLVYVNNLVASGGIINIGSIAGSSTFAHIIAYAPGGGEAASFIAGAVPAGYNATLFNNTTTHTIDLTLTAGTPKTLVWKGYINNVWDNSTKNWLDTTTSLQTNFTTGDSVIFDDTGTFSAINVAEDVVPRQAAGFNGMTMTNNAKNYTFSGSGGIRGAASFVKYGTGTVELDNYSEVAVTVNQGLLTGYGTIGSVLVVPGAACSWLSGGMVLGNVANSGSFTNAGTIAGSLTAQSGGAVNYNSGTVNGALVIQDNTYLYNSGTFNAIGTATVATNSIFVNAGTLYGSNLTVAVGATLTDTVLNSPGISAGSINVASLIINGVFNPGGNAIGTTKVTDFDKNGNLQGPPNGRVQLSAGSVTTLQYNSTNSQPYTMLLSQSQVYGPSSASKSINGCTLVITNVGPTAFAAGQTFQFFGQYYSAGVTPGNAGLNTTNTYPIIVPKTPGPGLLWDLSQLYASGTIGIISASSVQINLTNNIATVGRTNIVASFSWPTSYVGNGWLQQQITTLTNGLGTNWSDVGQSDYTNSITLTNVTTGNSAVFYRFVRP